jgi:periplasmic mercuric ion binding protein
MKKLIIAMMIILAGGFVSQANAQKKGREVVCFQSSMDCVNCEKTLYEELRFAKGVKDLKVDHVSNTILIEFVEKKNDEKSLAEVIQKKGYKAEKITRKKYDALVSKSKQETHQHGQEVHKDRHK